MEKQRQRAKAASNFEVDYNSQLKITAETEFTGYASLKEETKVLAVFRGAEACDQVATDEEAVLVLAKTPFYAECGGQAGDTGVITCGENCIFKVTDTKKVGNATIHIGRVELGSFSVGDTVKAEVDANARALICAHHSATHLLQAALRQVLGDHVAQKGSSVNTEHLRFDFSHAEPLTQEQLEAVEQLVNAAICRNFEVNTQVMDLEEAKSTGAMALFGEKYDSKVRVVRMGDFSCELCGGTHVARTGDIGMFKIVSDGGIAAGVRRIEAVVSTQAVAYVQKLVRELRESANLVKSDLLGVAQKVQATLEHGRELEHEVQGLKEKIALGAISSLMNSVVEINGVKCLTASLQDVEVKEMRTALDDIKNRLKSCVVLLASVVNGRVMLISGVTSDLTSKVKAGELVNFVAGQIGGKGGGRPDMAQAGGTDVAALPKAMEGVSAWLEEHLA